MSLQLELTPPPPVITNILDAVGPVQGTVPVGGATDDAQPTIIGTGIPGDLIYIYQNGINCGGTWVDANGNWSLKLAVALTNGLHDMTAAQFVMGGQLSGMSNHWPINVNLDVPAKPVMNAPTDDYGVPITGTTSDTHPVISGTGTAGDTITLYDGSKAIGSVIIGIDGRWSLKPATDLSSGTHDIYVIETNPAGNASAPSDHASIVVNTNVAPVITNVIDAVGPVQGTVAAGGVTDDPRPSISGTGIPGYTVNLYQNDLGWGAATVGADGKWTIKISTDLSNGVHDFITKQFGPDGVMTAASNHWSVTVDTTTPAKPVITGLTDDAGAAIPAGGSTINAHPTVSGTAKAGDIVTLYDGSTVIGSVKVGADGKWSIKPSKDLSVGSHDVYAIDTNLAGVVSPQSAHVAFTVTWTFAAPVILNVVDSVGPVQGTVAAGGVTDDPRPSISGTGIPGYTVYLYQNGLGCGEAKVSADGKWTIKITNELGNGAHDFIAKQFGSDGVFTTASNHWSITVDTTPVAKPVVNPMTDDSGHVIGGTTTDAHPNMSGTGKAGDTITVYDGSKTLGSVVIGADGKWSFKPTTDLSAGTHDIYVIETNLAGAVSPQSDHTAITVTSSLTAPVILNVVDALGPIQGTVAAGGVTDDPRPSVSGTGIPGYTVYLYQNNLGCGETKVGADGKWTIKLSSDLTNGAHDFTAKQFGSDGVFTAASNHWSVTVDTTTPAKPVITGLTDDAGAAIPTGGSTINAHPTVSGTAKAGDIVTLYDGATAIGSAKVGADGKWSIKPSKDLSVGSHDVYAIDTNLAGAVSPQSAHVAFTVTSSLTAPVILNVVDSVGPVQGTVAAGGVTDDPRPSISGTGIPGYTVYLYQNDLGCGEAKVGADGKWTIKLSSDLTNGAHDFIAKQFGSDGVFTTASNHWSITVDTTPVAKPVVNPMTDDSGHVIGGTTTDAHPNMSGTGKAGDTITVYDGSKTLGSVVIGADGKWSFKPTTDLSAGTHDIYVIETNLAGAVSPQSDHTAITVSTVLPAPTPVITQFIDAVGFVQGNIPSGGTSDDSRPTIKGTGHAGDTISLFDGTTAIGSTVVDSAGNWSVRLGDDLARGTHSIHANASSSTTSSSASSNTYVVLMTAPATVPVITQLIDAAGPVQGNVATGGTTDDKTPTLKGTGNPGDQVDIHDGSVTIGGTKVDASGNWSIKLPSLSDSVHTLTAWSFNGVNWSSSSVVYTVTVDTTTPAKPVITGLTDDAGAAIPAGGSTINAHPTVSGTAKAGDIVTLYDGATAIGSAKVGADGKWSIKPSKDLSVGSHDVYAIDTNLAGAVSPQSVHVAFTVTSSLTAPVILNVVDSVGPVQGTVAAGGVTDDPRPSISGTGIPGYTVYLYQNDLGCGEAKVGADGK